MMINYIGTKKYYKIIGRELWKKYFVKSPIYISIPNNCDKVELKLNTLGLKVHFGVP